jgi:hypothetical protein
MDVFQLCEIAASNVTMLEQICLLRSRAWATALPQAGCRASRPDRFDPVARHWVVLRNGEPVAAARLNVHQGVNDLPARGSYPDEIENQLPAPIASLSRLVVDPSLWGLGQSQRLDRVRVEAARQMGCSNAVSATLAGRKRIRQLEGLGFRVLGHGKPYAGSGTGRSPAPVVLLCNLVPAADHRAVQGPHLKFAVRSALATR